MLVEVEVMVRTVVTEVEETGSVVALFLGTERVMRREVLRFRQMVFEAGPLRIVPPRVDA